MNRSSLLLACLAVAATASPAPLWAQSPTTSDGDRLTLRAIRVAEGAIRLDGRLDDEAWAEAPVASGFRQVEPNAGEPVALDTEVRVVFDGSALYVGAVMRDTIGVEGLRIRDLRRDFDYFDNDHVSVTLDPFGDRRNAVVFQVNPYGALRDLQVRDGVDFNRDWAGLWDARTTRTEAGWIAEFRIPWETLRYPSGASSDRLQQAWGLQLSRNLRRSRELHAWNPWPRAFTPYHLAYAGTLLGVEPPPPGRNLRVQPYVLADAARVGDAALTEGAGVQVGGDLRWAVTPQTVLDLTVNTDFAQADADQQVIDLSRFSVFFPERRAFFLESADVFDVGYSFFTPFYSRRIGLDAGRPIPLDGGLRLVSSGAWGRAGALGVRQRGTDDVAAAWFGVGRASLNVGTEGRVGGMVVARHDEALDTPTGDFAGRTNTVAVLDGYTRLGTTAAATGFVSASSTSGKGGEGYAHYLWLRNEADWGYVGLIQDVATAEYEAATGFIFRRDIFLNSPAITLDLRPGWLPPSVRSLAPSSSAFVYHRPSDGAFLQADLTVEPLAIVFQSGARVSAAVRPSWQELDAEEVAFFRPLGAELTPGSYRYTQASAELSSDPSRRFSGVLDATTGGYFDGRLTTVRALGSVAPIPNLAFTLRYEYNGARSLGVDNLDVDSHLVGVDARVALSPQLQATAFWQYNTLADLASLNARLSWEFAPLSFLYLVVNDARYFVSSTDRLAQPDAFAAEQQVIFKVSYLGQL